MIESLTSSMPSVRGTSEWVCDGGAAPLRRSESAHDPVRVGSLAPRAAPAGLGEQRWCGRDGRDARPVIPSHHG